MRNPFRNPIYRKQYEDAVAAYQSKNKFLFHGNRPHRGNSWAANFWAGFNGVDGGLFRPNDPAYRRSPSYVMYRAGADCANNHQEN